MSDMVFDEYPVFNFDFQGKKIVFDFLTYTNSDCDDLEMNAMLFADSRYILLKRLVYLKHIFDHKIASNVEYAEYIKLRDKYFEMCTQY